MQELIGRQTASISDGVKRVEGGGTIAYVEDLLDAINAKIAADGGYTYLALGEGSITYDRAVVNPLIGTEATQATQMKGGSLRFANSKKPAFSGINDWNWTTVITSEGFLGLAATIAAITTGYIGSTGDTYIDLDNHTVQLGQTNGPHVIVDSGGVNIYNGATSIGFFGVEQAASIVRVGQASKGNVVMSSEGYVDIRYGSTVMAHFGYGEGKNEYGTASIAPYFNIGMRKSDSVIGNYSTSEGVYTESSGYASHAEGRNTVASGKYAHAEGYEAVASGDYSHAEGYQSKTSGMGSQQNGYYAHAEGYQTVASGYASHAEGYLTEALGSYSHAEGYQTMASGSYSHACGRGTIAKGDQFVCGKYNSQTYDLFLVGCGTGLGNEKNAFAVNVNSASFFSSSNTGTVYVNGSSVHSSDKRMKDHVAYLDEDAVDFVRALKPVRYRWKGQDGEHYGFYAQDVKAVDPHNTETVTEGERDEHTDFDPLTLDYNALIAPLVAYAQQLEKRVNAQDKTIEALEARLAKLEAKLA